MSAATDRLKKTVDEMNECPCEYHAKEAERAWNELNDIVENFLTPVRKWVENTAPIIYEMAKIIKACQPKRRKAPLRKGWR